MATYRELIQDIHKQLDQVYDKCGALRDAADWDEKNVFNETRGAIASLLSEWNAFDDSLSVIIPYGSMGYALFKLYPFHTTK